MRGSFECNWLYPWRSHELGYFIFLCKRGVEHLWDATVPRHELANWTGEICRRTCPGWPTVAGRQNEVSDQSRVMGNTELIKRMGANFRFAGNSPRTDLSLPCFETAAANQPKFMRRRRDTKRGWSRRLRNKNEPLIP
jgi:hypothetical protein